MTPTRDEARERLEYALEHAELRSTAYVHAAIRTEDLRALLSPEEVGPDQPLPTATPKSDEGSSRDHAHSSSDGQGNPALAASDTPRFRCKRCGRDEIDCRANGCERGPCPMEFVG